MIRTYTCEAIVLTRRNRGEADRLLTVFTREHGKKRVLAKGVRRVTSRRAPYLEICSHIQLSLYRGAMLDTVIEVATITSFQHLRQRLERIGFAYIALELVERLTADHQESQRIFEELFTFLYYLNEGTTTRYKAQENLSSFKQFLLSELGFIKEYPAIEPLYLDENIEQILEAKLRSPMLLTNIQSI